jgi:hypothetical protein
LKSSGLSNKHKRALFNVLKRYESFSVEVDLLKVHDELLSNTKSINRFKDYALKRAVKEKINALIKRGKISKETDIYIIVNIDEQGTATNGYYSLKDSIYEELKIGIINHNYSGNLIKPIFNGLLKVQVNYCESRIDYLIQASDILANRIWHSHLEKNIKLRKIFNHNSLTLP